MKKVKHQKSATIDKEHTAFLARINEAIDEFRNGKDDKGYYFFNKTSYLEYLPQTLYSILKGLIDSGKLKIGANFFDFGTGLCTNLMVASYLGLNAYGIEIDDELYEESKGMQVFVAEKFPKIKYQALCGTHYPKEYLKLRAMRKERLAKLERAIIKSIGREDRLDFGVEDKDPWSQLNVEFSDVDVFFIHAWGPDQPSIIEIFSAYAKKGAILIIDCPLKIEAENWECLGLEQESLNGGEYFLTAYHKIGGINDKEELRFNSEFKRIRKEKK